MEPIIGTLMIFCGNFAPVGWQRCDGTLLPIAENETLFMLLGTTYGGDGQTTFAVPDLRGRVPMHDGTGPGLPSYLAGQILGTESVTMTTGHMPGHSHPFTATFSPKVNGTGQGTVESPVGAYLSQTPGVNTYSSSQNGQTLAGPITGITSAAGTGIPYEIIQPSLAIQYCIATAGIFPSQQ